MDRDIQINRLCKPADPAFTISKITNMRGHFGVLRMFETQIFRRGHSHVWLSLRSFAAKAGGADRDRTDDLKLAKLALSQLSYGPRNRFNLACQA